MPKFRITQELRQVVIQRYWEEFDTTDQDAWDDLLSRLESDGAIDSADYPKEPPNDPAIWFALYKEMNCNEYGNQELDDWVSERKGFTECQFRLTTESGDEVMSEEL